MRFGLASVVCAVCASAWGATYQIHGIGVLPGPQPGWSEAHYINNAGVVTGISWERVPGVSDQRRAVAWQNGTSIRLPDVPGMQVSDQSYGGPASETGLMTMFSMGSNGSNPQAWIWDGVTLERFAPPGTSSGRINAVAADGRVFGSGVVYANNVYMGRQAYTWDKGAYTAMGTAGAYDNGAAFSSINAVSETGIVVGETELVIDNWGYNNRAFRWQNGNFTLLKPVATETLDSETWAEAVNRNGVAVGYSWQGSGYVAVKWDAGSDTPVILGSLGTGSRGAASIAEHVNDRGEIIGVSTKYVGGVSQGMRGFVWREGVMTELPSWGLSSSNTSETGVVAINENGQVIGYTIKYVDGVSMGQRGLFHDEAGNTLYIDSPEGTYGGWNFPRAIAADGTVFGEYSLYEDGAWKGDRAYYWSPIDQQLMDLGTLVDGGLEANGWRYLQTVTGTNDNGDIIGMGVRLNGDKEGYVLAIPEPAAGGLLLLAAGMVLRRRRSAA